MCNHEIQYLIGTADGIYCRKCGAKVSHPKPSTPKEEKAEEKPKKATRKPAAKKGAK